VARATAIVPDAFIITKTERFGDTHRIITGTFKAKVYGYDASYDYQVEGKFKVKHEFTSTKF
jgi:hypothetical protein